MSVRVSDGGFDSAYLQQTIEKQMSFMNQYGENLERDINRLADNIEQEQYVMHDEDLDTQRNWGMTWGYHNGILEAHDLKTISDAIAKIRKQGYNGYNFKNKYKLVYLGGDKAAFVTNSFRHPNVEYIVECNNGITDDQYDLIRSVFGYAKHGEARQILENVYGSEDLRIYDSEDFRYDAWKNGGGSGSNSRTGNKGSGSREVQGLNRSIAALKIDYERAVRYGQERTAKRILQRIAEETGHTGDLTAESLLYDEDMDIVSKTTQTDLMRRRAANE